MSTERIGAIVTQLTLLQCPYAHLTTLEILSNPSDFRLTLLEWLLQKCKITHETTWNQVLEKQGKSKAILFALHSLGLFCKDDILEGKGSEDEILAMFEDVCDFVAVMVEFDESESILDRSDGLGEHSIMSEQKPNIDSQVMSDCRLMDRICQSSLNEVFQSNIELFPKDMMVIASNMPEAYQKFKSFDDVKTKTEEYLNEVNRLQMELETLQYSKESSLLNHKDINEMEKGLDEFIKVLKTSVEICRKNIGPWLELAETAAQELKPIPGMNQTVQKCIQDMSHIVKFLNSVEIIQKSMNAMSESLSEDSQSGHLLKELLHHAKHFEAESLKLSHQTVVLSNLNSAIN